ncbi:Isoleucine--tRNA ligase [Labeo rohita]|uniref:Isoleucine--tRNA ligase n=1 Tax=Labeo rohita TaxID=84645 RepID=A0ABQ8MGI8_LABRO|nr:Isoleucine--tRNA ligase [Labeo rohita]
MENHPYAQRTDLDWSIVGCSYPANDYGDATGISHRTSVRQVVPLVKPSFELKKEVHFVCRTLVNEVISADIIKAFELDCTDHSADDNPVSQEDILFLSKLREESTTPTNQGRSVFFDCSARFQETSLNNHLLTGPDLTKTLEHQDYLSFLWWDDGNLDSRPSVYRMKVHLFGAASSPGCSNFGLKYLVSQGQGKLSEESIKFIRRSFYVDVGLTSVKSSAEAVHLVREARVLCKTGNFRLHKFVCNDKEVISTIPPEECAQTKDLDMALGELHIERGVLSTVASVYDPLGFVAPFLLVGKQIFQELCKDKVNWDEDLSEHILPQWESWLRDLPHLAALKIPRSYLPSDFDESSEIGQISCSLVIGKARVAPTRLMTIPRLELSAVVTSVCNGDVAKRKLEIENLKEYYWTDSRVVIARGAPIRLQRIYHKQCAVTLILRVQHRLRAEMISTLLQTHRSWNALLDRNRVQLGLERFNPLA